MKNLFLSLALIATLTVVSCKKEEAAPAEEGTTTEAEAPVAEPTTEAAPADTAAASSTEAAPVAETPAK